MPKITDTQRLDALIARLRRSGYFPDCHTRRQLDRLVRQSQVEDVECVEQARRQTELRYCSTCMHYNDSPSGKRRCSYAEDGCHTWARSEAQ